MLTIRSTLAQRTSLHNLLGRSVSNRVSFAALATSTRAVGQLRRAAASKHQMDQLDLEAIEEKEGASNTSL